MSVVGLVLAALLSGDGYKPTMKHATGTGMENSFFHKTFKQTSCMEHISLYEARWGSMCLLSHPSGPDLHKESQERCKQGGDCCCFS